MIAWMIAPKYLEKFLPLLKLALNDKIVSIVQYIVDEWLVVIHTYMNIDAISKICLLRMSQLV